MDLVSESPVLGRTASDLGLQGWGTSREASLFVSFVTTGTGPSVDPTSPGQGLSCDRRRLRKSGVSTGRPRERVMSSGVVLESCPGRGARPLSSVVARVLVFFPDLLGGGGDPYRWGSVTGPVGPRDGRVLGHRDRHRNGPCPYPHRVRREDRGGTDTDPPTFRYRRFRHGRVRSQGGLCRTTTGTSGVRCAESSRTVKVSV